MKKLYLLFTALLFFQVNAFAQLEYFNKEQGQIISSEQRTDAITINLDSLMLDSIFIAYNNSESIPGIASLIIKDNNLIWNNNYGYRNLELQLPVEDSTMFLIASISKTFIATAIMQLWENELINLDGNINNYLPDGLTVVNPNFPNDIITVEMLMTHTSSLKDNWNTIYEQLWSCGDYPESIDSFLVNYFMPGGRYYSLGNFSNYPPGSSYNYSNSTVSLLALMIKHLSGKNIDEYIIDSIFTPLSMNSSSWFLQGMDTSKIATPYRDNPPQALCHFGFAWWPCVQLRTSKIELSNYMSTYINGGVYNNNRILDSNTVSLMLSDHMGYPLSWGGAQGLIWYTDPGLLNTVWGHDGGWFGCQTSMYFNPTENWGIIFLINKGIRGFVSPGFYPLLIQMANYAHCFGNIYALGHSVDKTYARKDIDPVLFRTKFSNIYNHPFMPHIIYADLDSTQIDSLTLFDDGMHGDSLSNDGLYGNFIPPRSLEDYFTLSVSTIDNQTTKYFNTPDIGRFTTVGPVVLDSISWTKMPTYYSIKPLVKNQSTITTITSPSIRLICNDPWVTSVTPDLRYMPSIPPGATVGPALPFNVTVDTSIFPNYFNFKVEVMKDGWVYWTDTMRVIVGIITGVEEELQPLTYRLEQNYPNPFNPSTKISWQSPVSSYQTLKIFDILGNEVATLIDEYKPAGKYEVEFNASSLPSGVYFYQLRAGSFVQTKKMILLK